MPRTTTRTAAVALAAATALASPSWSSPQGIRPLASTVPPHEGTDLPPALDALLAILGTLPEQADREPAWRNPQTAPRPSPDRDFILPMLKARS